MGLPINRAYEFLTRIAAFYSVKPEDILGPRRYKTVALARHLVAKALHYNLGWSYSEIGRYLGGRDHSTIIAGVKRAERELESRPELHHLMAR